MTMRICRVGLTLGSVVGWAGGLGVGVFHSDEHTIPMMMALLSLAIFCSGALAMRCYQRPLDDAYELGYNRGRRDAIREATKTATFFDVTPIKRARGVNAVSQRPRTRV